MKFQQSPSGASGVKYEATVQRQVLTSRGDEASPRELREAVSSYNTCQGCSKLVKNLMRSRRMLKAISFFTLDKSVLAWSHLVQVSDDETEVVI